ncbi:hypothetical protein T484DRAFT_1824436 [Baffinella frigidus]|nr:hypothetical protein T484DRAFT_1824436 [Cryptophyta sp. CCMP2293]
MPEGHSVYNVTLFTCTDAVNTDMLTDACGGHASPYHYHKDLACHYDATDATKHSVLSLSLSLSLS